MTLNKMVLCFLVITMMITVTAADAKKLASQSSPIAKSLPLDERFQRDEKTSIITDFQTGLRWLEGPNKATSWDAAQSWITTLGPEWRTPTRAEVKTLFIKGAGDGACRNMVRVFRFPAAVSSIWAERRDSASAWEVSFKNGGDCWERNNFGFSFGYRALAVFSAPLESADGEKTKIPPQKVSEKRPPED
ncbi:MAG: DUF1566 domain-containing protein [Candidatus Ozemobacteraceae bacterium]